MSSRLGLQTNIEFKGMVFTIDPYSAQGSIRLVIDISEAAGLKVDFGGWATPFWMECPKRPEDVETVKDLLREKGLIYRLADKKLSWSEDFRPADCGNKQDKRDV